MKVSFVVPAHNEEKYIEDCLSSIFSITGLPDYEVIVVDNNSTDRTADVVKKKYSRVRVVSESKPGPAAARNAGAKVASGDLIAFIDADCKVPGEWWKKVEEKFRKSSQLVLLYGPYKYHEVENLIQRIIFYISNVLVVGVYAFVGIKLLRTGGPAFGGDTVVRRSAFERVGGFNDKFDFYGEDIDLVNRMIKIGKVSFAPQIWVYSSDRRLRQEGVVKMWFVYSVNTFSTTFFGKPIIKKHKITR